MRRSRKRRLVFAAGVLATVGSVAALSTGVTYGFFSATSPSQDNTFSSGTVSLSQPFATSCSVTAIQPGDAGSCQFTVTYAGTVSGGVWLGMDLAVTNPVPGVPVAPYAPGASGDVPAAAAGLYDSSASGLQVTITDNQPSPVTYMSGTTWNGAPTVGATPSVADLLVDTTPVTATSSVTFTVSWQLPISAGNAYDGAASTISILVHAVQAANNGNQVDVAACGAGDACAAIPNWS